MKPGRYLTRQLIWTDSDGNKSIKGLSVIRVHDNFVSVEPFEKEEEGVTYLDSCIELIEIEGRWLIGRLPNK